MPFSTCLSANTWRSPWQVVDCHFKGPLNGENAGTQWIVLGGQGVYTPSRDPEDWRGLLWTKGHLVPYMWNKYVCPLIWETEFTW
jgi:hypothetical protein